MKLVIIMAHGLRIMANGMRAVENALYYRGCAVRRRLTNVAEEAYAKANQLREHADFVGGQHRTEKVEQAIAEVNKEIDHRVAEAHHRADNHDDLGNKLYDILGDCK